MQLEKMLDIKMSVRCKNNKQDIIINVYEICLILVRLSVYSNFFFLNSFIRNCIFCILND